MAILLGDQGIEERGGATLIGRNQKGLGRVRVPHPSRAERAGRSGDAPKNAGRDDVGDESAYPCRKPPGGAPVERHGIRFLPVLDGRVARHAGEGLVERLVRSFKDDEEGGVDPERRRAVRLVKQDILHQQQTLDERRVLALDELVDPVLDVHEEASVPGRPEGSTAGSGPQSEWSLLVETAA